MEFIGGLIAGKAVKGTPIYYWIYSGARKVFR